MPDKPRVIDLFCGAGGMSTGFEFAGFDVIAGVDNDSDSIQSFGNNHTNAMALKKNLVSFSPSSLAKTIDTRNVELVMGGPPCQGFSLASMNPQARANYGRNSEYDDRNSLYSRFFRYVDFFRPIAFLMENVPGLRFRSNGLYIKRVKNSGQKLGYKVSVWDLLASDFGVPQNRRRVFIIGTRNQEIDEPMQTHYSRGQRGRRKHISTGEAILDLPRLKAGDDQQDVMDYDKSMIKRFEQDPQFRQRYARWTRKGSSKIRYHVSRMHSERDLKIFSLIEPGKSSAQLPDEKKELIPYSMESFADKYRRQPIHEPSSTVTAHIAKDGLYYIHPTQNRSLTPREAARLQSFRDRHIFHGSRTSIFRQIGNAMPPLLAKAIAEALIEQVL